MDPAAHSAELSRRRAAVTAAWHDRTGGRFASATFAPAQRANQIALPGLRAEPWWEPSELSFVRAFEAAHAAIACEVASLRAYGHLQPRPIAEIPECDRTGDQQLIEGERGGWEVFRIHYNGLWFEPNAALCPVTASLARSVARRAGTIGFGVPLPGTRTRPHCGLSNAKLRCHLGIDVPAGCGLRVDGETRRWRDGECLVFDDSFEHEVWNEGDRARIVLMLDVFHPDLGDEDLAWVAAQGRPPPERHEAIAAAARWRTVPSAV